MKTEIKLDPKDVDYFMHRMEKYRGIIHKSQSDSMIELGKSVARQLAFKTQPYGLSASVGKKYQASIRGQVERALSNANITAGAGNAPTEHGSRRDGRGRVPKGLPERGQFKRVPFEIQERKDYAIRKSKNAGMLKAAWIAAGQKLGGPPMSRVAAWISGHVKRMEGAARVITGGMFKDHEIWLTNKLKYAGRALREGEMQKAIKEAFRRQIDRMIIEKSRAENKIAKMENAVKR